MITAQSIILLCWGIFLFYWLINWWKVKPTLEEKFSVGKFRGIILVIVAVLLLNHFVLNNAFHLPACQWNWLGCHYHFFSAPASPWLPLQIISAILAMLGLMIAIMAHRTLAGNWSAALDLKHEHELITTGIYH